jgi:ABC-type transport system involved in multi-copper enzyme maturation permease subunit
MTQTLALFLDAYRELNARKMFWITLALSAVVCAAFAATDLNERGITFLWFQFDAFFNSKFVTRDVFYRYLFGEFAVGIWLAWIANLLALISTAGMVPDLITGGSIDLFLSKPIARPRLLLTKFLAGLMFAALQVGLFTAAAYLVIGIRTGAWDASIFVAVPLVTLIFSYLFAVCTLLGLLTRSALAALLLTILFWMSVWGLSIYDGVSVAKRIAADTENRAYDRQFAQYAELITRLESQAAAPGSGAAALLESTERQRDDLRRRRAESDPRRRGAIAEQRAVYWVRSFLPKTSDMVGVLKRRLGVKEDETIFKTEDRDEANRGGLFGGGGGGGASHSGGGRRGFFGIRLAPSVTESTDVNWKNIEVQGAAYREIRDRPAWWIIGTSVGFEAVVLGIASWIFSRRDF